MLKSLASLLFYARFLNSFSALGYRRRSRHWAPLRLAFRGQRWLVSGATGGIGRAVALAAAAGGASVLALARDPVKLEALRRDGGERIEPLRVDLASMRALRKTTVALAEQGQPIEVLVNNVGVLLNDYRRTEEDLEASFATNLLGHFVLTEGLAEAGLLKPEGIVINVSSGGMYGTPLKLAAMAGRNPDVYDGMAAYAMHKRAQVELTRHWNQRWQGRPAVHVMHPGWADTEGVRRALPWFRAVLKRVLRDADQAADTILWLAATRPAPPANGGIWLDRELHAEHAFAFTRNGETDAEGLATWLREQAAAATD